MTPFTDDELLRLKEQYSIAGIEAIGNKLPALLARLEAAERIFKCDPEDSEAQRKAFERWRKAAGRTT